MNLHDTDKEKTPACWAVWDCMGCSSYFFVYLGFLKLIYLIAVWE